MFSQGRMPADQCKPPLLSAGCSWRSDLHHVERGSYRETEFFSLLRRVKSARSSSARARSRAQRLLFKGFVVFVALFMRVVLN